MDASILQPDGSEIASKLVSLLSITTMTSLFGIKTYNVQFKYLTYSRWLVLHLYIISWAFTAAGMLFVTTNNGNYLSCLLSELFCDIFYSGTKIVIYCWLIEKVWVVSSVRQSRWRTKSYRFHVFLLTPYIAIFTLMIVFHIAELQETGFCVIGLQPIASIPLLVYDFVFNMYFTLLFVKPLMKIGKSVEVDWKSSRLHDVALRTLAASVVCLFVSFANILALVILNGRERGVVCLTCCTVDVTINVITIHWVTNNPTGKTSKDAHGSSNGIDSFSPDETAARRADPDSKTSATYRRPADIYNVGIDEYLAQTNPTMKHTYTGGTVGYYNQNGDSDQNMMGTATGAIPIGRQEQYRYLDGRFVMITEKEDDDGQDSKPSSIPESHNSRKSLTKYADNRPDSP